MYFYNMHEGPLKVDNSMRDWFLDTEGLHICRGFAVMGDLRSPGRLSSRLRRHRGPRSGTRQWSRCPLNLVHKK